MPKFFDTIPGGSQQDEKQFFTRRYIYRQYGFSSRKTNKNFW
jgi:hypothetical protein